MLDELQPFTGTLKTTDVKPGAYVITHVGTGLLYAGSARKPAERISYHIYRLKNGIHSNEALQDAYNSSPELEWKYFLVKDREAAYDLEQALIDHYKPKGKLFNVSTDVRSAFGGRKLKKEHAEKLKNSRLGKSNSPEHRERISKANKGKKRTEEYKQRSSEMRKGIPLPAETYNKAWKATRRPLMGDGVRYEGCRDCCRKLNIDTRTVRYRIKSKLPKYNNWYYLDE